MKRKRFSALFVALITPTAAVEANSLAECRSIADEATRLACYDALAAASAMVDQADEGPLTTAVPRAAAEAGLERSTKDTVSLDDPVDLFGRSDREIRDVAVRKTTNQSLERIVAIATTVLEKPSGRLVVTLDNDQIWEQSESQRFRLREGDEVEIWRGRLGTYFLKRSGTNRSIRVRRQQ